MNDTTVDHRYPYELTPDDMMVLRAISMHGDTPSPDREIFQGPAGVAFICAGYDDLIVIGFGLEVPLMIPFDSAGLMLEQLEHQIIPLKEQLLEFSLNERIRLHQAGLHTVRATAAGEEIDPPKRDTTNLLPLELAFITAFVAFLDYWKQYGEPYATFHDISEAPSVLRGNGAIIVV